MFLLDRLLRRFVHIGPLTIVDARGRTYRYGEPAPGVVPVRLRFTDRALPFRMVRDLSMGAGEGYMDGSMMIEKGDPRALAELVTLNAARHTGGDTGRIMHGATKALAFLREANPAKRSRINVAHHYDLSDRLYDLFLDPERQYSCGYWRSPDVGLEQAQRDKMALIAAKLCLQPGMRVLDIGCGWGGMALHLAREHGADVTGITLSQEQLAYARARAAREGLADRVRFELVDYRALGGEFDRIVSVGMFEHVGRPHFAEFFQALKNRLAPDGVALLHTIGRAFGPGATDPWTAKYIFPGGYVPAVSEVIPHIEANRLWLADMEGWRLHYMHTLDAWYDRCVAHKEAIVALNGERFYRMWTYYLAGARAAFKNGGLVVHHYQLAKRRDAVPITRDYLLASPAFAR